MRPVSAVTLLTVLMGTCYAARLDSTYLPPGNARGADGSGSIPGPRPGNGGGVSGRPGTFGGLTGGGGGPGGPGGPGGSDGGGPTIPIVSFESENNGDGNYRFSYETGNGITAQETGQPQGDSEAVSGSYSYTGPDGVQYTVTYTADADGFHPQGAHLPTPPPIPPEIQRGVELSLAAEARGENQDGGSGGSSYEGPPATDGRRGNVGGGSAYQGPNSYQTSANAGYRY